MDYIKEIKEIVAEQAYEQLKHNLDKVDTKELGEVIDMIKDTAEAAYYCSVVEAMEKAEEEAKENGNTVYYTERYLPYYPVRYLDWDRNDKERYMDDKYGRMYADTRSMNSNDQGGTRYATDRRRSDGRYTADRDGDGRYNENRYHDMPYYDFMEPVARDLREGRSPRTRRMYMEAKQQHQGKEVQLQELEKYMGELSQDVTEMIADATLEEKQMLHKKLAALTNKIELLTKPTA